MLNPSPTRIEDRATEAARKSARPNPVTRIQKLAGCTPFGAGTSAGRTTRLHIFGEALEDVRIVKVQNLYAASGIPRARYRIPTGSYVSDDGGAIFTSGTIDASCFVQERRVFGMRVTAGYLTYGTLRGDVRKNGGGGGGGSFISYNSGSGFSDLPEDAHAALEAYLFSGQCTEGWVIYIDGDRVC